MAACPPMVEVPSGSTFTRTCPAPSAAVAASMRSTSLMVVAPRVTAESREYQDPLLRVIPAISGRLSSSPAMGQVALFPAQNPGSAESAWSVMRHSMPSQPCAASVAAASAGDHSGVEAVKTENFMPIPLRAWTAESAGPLLAGLHVDVVVFSGEDVIDEDRLAAEWRTHRRPAQSPAQ